MTNVTEVQEVSREESDCSLIKHFGQLEDLRDSTKVRHKLLDMIAISVAAVICGAADWVGIAAFAWAERRGCASFWICPTGFPRTTPSGGFSRCWHPRRSSSAFATG